MQRAACLVCFFLIPSIFLQGCDFGESSGRPGTVQKIEQDVEQDVAAVMPKKAKASCSGGHFHCNGGWKDWCKRMKKQCKAKDCAPLCSWTCDSPKCNQHCGPVCNQPVCSTRCKGFNTDSCKMKCGKPMCKVVCPKHFCPTQDCAACKTECGKPTCKMQCGNDDQPCRNVCAQPVCNWECKNPSLCPKPKCAMKCKKAPDCMQKRNMFAKVPPLEPGETEIVTVDGPGPAPSPAAASFMSTKSSTLRVNFTRMGEDHALHQGQVDLALVQMDSTDEASAWTKEVIEHHGHLTEHEAYCIDGKARCHGDEAWCAEELKSVCTGDARSESIFAHRRSGVQSALQP